MHRRIVTAAAAGDADSNNGSPVAGAPPPVEGAAEAQPSVAGAPVYASGMPLPGVPFVREEDRMYHASLDRILQLQEAVEVLAASVETVQPMVASLRTQVRETLLAATAPPVAVMTPTPAPAPAQAAGPAPAPARASAPGSGSESALASAPASASELAPASAPAVSALAALPAAAGPSSPGPSITHAEEAQNRSREARVPDAIASLPARSSSEATDSAAAKEKAESESTAASSADAGSSRNVEPAISEADQLRQRRLHFLERSANRGPTSAGADELQRSGDEE